MTVKIAEDYDFGNLNVSNFALQVVPGDHGSPVIGTLYVDSTAGQLAYSVDGAALLRVPLAGGGGGDADSLQGFSAAALLNRDNHTGTQLASTISNFDAAADARIDAQKGAANGVATLDGAGLIPSAQLPAQTIGQRFTAADETAMTALTAQIGDVAVRTDLSNQVFILTADDASVAANWLPIVQSGGGVQSVNGDVGPAVLLTTADVADSVDARYVTDAQLATVTGLPARVAGSYGVSFGDGSTLSHTITHNLNLPDPRACTLRITEGGTGDTLVLTPTNATANAFDLVFPAGQAPPADTYVVVQG